MQNMDMNKFLRIISDYGYKKVRQNGGSHGIYERVVLVRVGNKEVTLKDTISVPTGKTVNGCMARRLIKQMDGFEEYICDNRKWII